MKNIFDSENFVFKSLSKLFDGVVLSVVFTLFCLPVITIGPAITALYYSTVKSLRRNRSYVLKEFFYSFKRDFKQSFLLEMILLLVFAILYVDIKLSIEGSNTWMNIIRYLYLMIGIVFAAISIYAFPLISRFSLGFKELFKLSFYLSIRHLLTTIVSSILLFGAFVAVYLTMGVAMLLLPAVTCLLLSIMLERVLKGCMKLVKNVESAENTDTWYME